MKRILVCLSLSLIASATVIAQTTAFTYQGFLTDSGAPANGVYDLTFMLFNAPSGGSAVGMSNAVDDLGVTNGLFTVSLNFGSAPFDGSDRWIEIAVRPGASSGDYTNLTPRQQITSTPYAINALTFSGPVAASQLTGTISSNSIGAGSITTVMLAAGGVGSNQLAAGAVTTGALADNAVAASKLAAVTVPRLQTTFTKPTPASGDNFGWSVAAVGTDRVLIGSYYDDAGALNAGAAYLFSTDGTLVRTFTNPTPATSDYFGTALAAVGSDRVLIGAYSDNTGASDAGAAYLFSTNGTLLTTFTNPTPTVQGNFGWSVATVGSDRLLIAAPFNAGVSNAGVAYLFSTNGTLLTTFTNPTPQSYDFFGGSVAAMGSDRVLIGAHHDNTGATWAGAAYLFSTNGTLLTTFNNPTPQNFDIFGVSVAAVGTDRVLIGAQDDDTAATDAGAAYLFSTNGALLTTFTKPAPQAGDRFGVSVAAVGSDRVLIGAHQDDTGANDAGAVYLFNTNGAFIAAFTNPAPQTSDEFGMSVAVVGTDRVLIGAHFDSNSLGSAYLLNVETYVPGLVAEGVKGGSITTASLQDGAVTAAKIGGTLNASQIPSLDAAKIASGTVSDARLSTNVALRNGNNSFTGTNSLNDIDLRLRNPGDANHGLGWYGTSGPNKPFAGADLDGPALYGFGGGGLGTTFGGQQLALVWNSAGNVGIGTNSPGSRLTVNGTVSATSFSGGGGSLTGLNAGNLTSGTLSYARLPAGVPTNASELLTNNATGVNLSGTFSGNGGGITNVLLESADASGALSWTSTYGRLTNAGPSFPYFQNADAVSMIAMDINGDGHMDLIAPRSFENTLIILTNNGRGVFSLSDTIPGFNNAQFITAADVNGDGKPDAIVVNIFGPSVSVLTNTGTGTFVLSGSYGVVSYPHNVAVADFNGDGKVDIICANSGASYFTVLTNNGSGSFSGYNLATGSEQPGWVGAMDLNSDGIMDLVSVNGNILTTRTNNGSGVFTVTSNLTLSSDIYQFEILDVNGDSKLDLVASTLSPTVVVLTNNGNGGFVLATNLTTPANNSAIVPADFNGDGKMDFAALMDTGFTLFTNAGSGNFVSAGYVSGPVSAGYAGEAADFNGDGRPDLVTGPVLTLFTNARVSVAASFIGNGGDLTGIHASNVTGVFTASQIPNLNANKLTSGTLNDARLSTNVAQLGNSQTFSGAKSFTNAANTFVGNGSGLTGLNASNLTSGTVSDARLSTNVALLSDDQTFFGSNTFSGVVRLTNAGNTLAGNGAALTALNAASLATGTVADARLSANVALLNGINQFTGTNALNDTDLRLRTGTNHGLGWHGSGKTFAGYAPDGPMLWGNAAGGLGTVSGGQKVALNWTSAGRVGIGITNPATPLHVAGTVTATLFTGNGNGLTNLDATELTGAVPAASLTSVPAASLTGILDDARLSTNVALLGDANVFAASNRFSGDVRIDGALFGSAPYLKYAEVTTNTTQGGAATAGTNNWREFTMEMADTHNLGSLSAGDIVLPAGTYQCRISAPGYGVATTQARLRTSTGSTLMYGTIAYSGAGAANDRSLIEGQFTLLGTTTLRVQQYCRSGNGNGLGALDNVADIWGEGTNFNVFATAEFWKIK